MQAQTARDLLDECARGPEPAWERFVERFGDAIEAGVRRALRPTGEARRPGIRRTGSGVDPVAVHEDMVQECYCRLLEEGGRRLRGFRGFDEPEIRAWLARLAERCTRDRLRAARAEKRGGRRIRVHMRSAESVADPGASPERRAIGREELRSFSRLCRRMSRSERDARVLHMVFFAGLGSREVSRILRGDLTPSGVDTVVLRFRRRMRDEGLAGSRALRRWG